MIGWIKIHRQIQEHWIWSNPVFTQRWLIMLFNVNHKDGKMLLGYNTYTIEAGQSSYSLRKWAALFDCGTKQVTKFFDLLENDEMIKRSVIGKGKQSTTLITIENYEDYQSEQKRKGNARETQKKRKGNAEGIQSKNVKNDKELYIKTVSSPPEGVDALHFYLAKGYHKMLHDYKGSESLEKADLYKWVNTIRLLIDVDKVPITQLIAIKKFLEAGINKERGVDTFWCDTIFSISAFRKKSKDGTYRLDRIKQAAKKWLDKNPESEELVYKAEQLLMSRVNG